MSDTSKVSRIFLSLILVLGIAGIIAILSGGKFVYAISDPISSPADPSPSPIVSEPITPSPSPVVSPSPVISPSPVVSPSVIPSPTPAGIFKAEFFNNEKLKGKPVFATTVSEINFDWGKGSPDPSVKKDGFSARFKGTQFFEGGRYKVTTSNDDGLKFYLDGNLVHSAWYDQGALKRTFKMDIPRGNHWIVVDYYEAGGLASAMIKWEKI